MTQQNELDHEQPENNPDLEQLGQKAADMEKTDDQREAETAQEVAKADEAQMTADMVAGTLEAVLTMLFPVVDIHDQTRRQCAEVLKPLIEKYGVEIGGRWAAEMNAIAFFGMTGFGIYNQIQAAKAAEKRKAQGAANGAQSESIAA